MSTRTLAVVPDLDRRPPLMEHARRLIATALPSVEDRRTALRRLATDVDDHDPDLLRVLVGCLVDMGLAARDRTDRWEQLVEHCALATAISDGSIEPRHIVPGANPNSAHTVATEAIEQDIRRALAVLVAGGAV